jgi:hypothetical protein
MPTNLVKTNLKTLFYSAPHFIQFMYVAKILWWGIGGALGVRFIITYLNYLVIGVSHWILILIGMIGLIGILFNKYALNVIFALSMLFISACIGYTFITRASETISAGTYFIDIFGTIWLFFRIQNEHYKKKRYLEFRK